MTLLDNVANSGDVIWWAENVAKNNFRAKTPDFQLYELSKYVL
jgi:hypothetical protein